MHTGHTNDVASIRRWMKLHLEEHRDSRTGELNCTGLVEAWDAAAGTGTETDEDREHPAWDVAVELVEEGGEDTDELQPECPVTCNTCGRYAHGARKGAGHRRCGTPGCECYCTRIR